MSENTSEQASDQASGIPTDGPGLAGWLISHRWHELTGPDAVDGAMEVLELLADQLQDQAPVVFQEAMHRVRYRDGCPVCPECGAMPYAVFAGSQAICPTSSCSTWTWNPSVAGGGPARDVTVTRTTDGDHYSVTWQL